MSGFGRKGLAGGQQMAPAAALAMRGAAAQMRGHTAQVAADAMSPQLAAFLASERSRSSAIEPSLSDIATRYSATQPPRLGQQPPSPSNDARADKSPALAYALWWFLGCFGGHRFYLRAYKSASWQLGQWPAMIIIGQLAYSAGVGALLAKTLVPLWFLSIFLWFVADAFMIPGMVKKANAR